MKTLLKVSMIASVLGLSSVAQAQDPEAGVYVGATYTYWKASGNGDNGSVNKSGATLKAGYDFNQNWAAEGRLNFAQYKSDGVKVSTPAAVYVKYRYPVTQTIAPYAVLGLAYNRFTGDNASGTSSVSSNSVGLSAGLGAEFAISQQLKTTVEYTYLGNNDVDDGFNYDTSGISAGVLYKF